jgi:hypothetical protein
MHGWSSERLAWLVKVPPWEPCSPPPLAHYAERRTVGAPPKSRRMRKIKLGVVLACVDPLEGGRTDPTSVSSRVPHHTHEHTSRRRGSVHVPPEMPGEDLS